MSKLLVRTDKLNLRRTPDKTTNDNIISAMPLGQEVTVISSSPGQLFWEIETISGGLKLRGFASSKYLRKPLSSAKEKLLAAAVREWIFFNRGTGHEGDEPYYKRVGDYFKKLGMSSDGKDHDHFWSAAFISFIVREAGYADFKFSDGHWEYIYDAKAKRLADKAKSPYWLFRLDEHKPQLGDLVCAWRNNERRTYEDVPNHFFPSHTDIIIEIDDDSVTTIGGNVEQSVKEKVFPLDKDGFITAKNKRFAIMRNNR